MVWERTARWTQCFVYTIHLPIQIVSCYTTEIRLLLPRDLYHLVGLHVPLVSHDGQVSLSFSASDSRLSFLTIILLFARVYHSFCPCLPSTLPVSTILSAPAYHPPYPCLPSFLPLSTILLFISFSMLCLPYFQRLYNVDANKKSPSAQEHLKRDN